MSKDPTIPLRRLLEVGDDDWVHFPDVLWAFGGVLPEDENAPRDFAMMAPYLRFLIDAGLMRAGDLVEPSAISPSEPTRKLRFQTIPGGTNEVLEEIQRRLSRQDGRILIGDVCWFEITELGHAAAKSLLREDASGREPTDS